MIRIESEGMGGFLNPPGDAEHFYSVRDIDRGNTSYMSLRYALTVSWLTVSEKERIEKVLAEHQGHITPDWIQFVHDYLGSESAALDWIHKFFPDYQKGE